MSVERTNPFPYASYPAVRLTLLLIAGMIADYHLNPALGAWLMMSATVFCVYLFLEKYHSSHISTSGYNMLIICYMLAVITFGGAWHAAFDRRDPPSHVELISNYHWEELAFSGLVCQVSTTAGGNFNLDIAVDSTFLADSLLWGHSYNLRAHMDPQKFSKKNNPQVGQHIRFTATIYPLESPRNPHEFDYQHYLYRQHIYARAGIKAIVSVHQQSDKLFSWLSIRRTAYSWIDRSFSEPAAPLAKALLLGHKQELPPDVRTSFSRAGLAHVMAVSGLHVGFLIVPFWFMIPWFWTRRYGKHVGLFLLIFLLFLYAGVTGFSASVTRASLAGGLLIYARLFHKLRDSRNLMAVAATLILLVDPGQLFTIGFQLSFTAVYIILLILPVFNGYAPEGFVRRWYGRISLIIFISLIVQAGLYPFLTYYFGEFSLVGPLSNVLVVPTLSLILPYALFLLPLASVIPGVVPVLLVPADIFLVNLSRFAGWSASLNGSWISVQTNDLMVFAIWFCAICLLASVRYPRRRWKWLVILLAIICLHQGKLFIQNLQPPLLKITVLDVGQGDAVLVQSPDRRHFLIDTGRWQPENNSGRSILIPHLEAEGVHRLNGIFLSHPHADHIGGISDILKVFPVDTIYQAESDYDSRLFRDFRQQASQNNIPIRTLSSGDRVVIDPAIRIFVYGPGPGPAASSNINNRSLILELIYGNTELLFMGDAEARQETELLAAFEELINTDFLKVAHHGSKTSTTAPFLLQSTPDIAVISVGLNNRFQHPHRQTVNRLRKFGADVYFTSLQGALLFESDGRSISRRRW